MLGPTSVLLPSTYMIIIVFFVFISLCVFASWLSHCLLYCIDVRLYVRYLYGLDALFVLLAAP